MHVFFPLTILLLLLVQTSHSMECWNCRKNFAGVATRGGPCEVPVRGETTSSPTDSKSRECEYCFKQVVYNSNGSLNYIYRKCLSIPPAQEVEKCKKFIEKDGSVKYQCACTTDFCDVDVKDPKNIANNKDLTSGNGSGTVSGWKD